MKLALLVFIAALLGIAVISNLPDYGRCLASETYVADEPYILTFIPVGQTMMPIYGSQRVTHARCTRWEFPEGRP